MVLWIYTMVIRLVLTYGSVVWRPRDKYVSGREYSMLQRLACLAVTG